MFGYKSNRNYEQNKKDNIICTLNNNNWSIKSPKTTLLKFFKIYYYIANKKYTNSNFHCY